MWSPWDVVAVCIFAALSFAVIGWTILNMTRMCN